MNTKRQTIWLVSMLSLMVVLSAYYLFTTSSDDLNSISTSGSTVEEQVKIDMSQEDPSASVQGDTAVAITGDYGAGTKQPAAGGDVQSVQGKAQSGEEFFLQTEMDRHEQLTKDTEKWMNIASDKKQSQEEIAKAENNILRIEETTAKLEKIEDSLRKQFKNAIVTEEKDGKWKVTVQASKLESKQAVAIIDLVMKEMNVGPEKIAGVHYQQ